MTSADEWRLSDEALSQQNRLYFVHYSSAGHNTEWQVWQRTPGGAAWMCSCGSHDRALDDAIRIAAALTEFARMESGHSEDGQ